MSGRDTDRRTRPTELTQRPPSSPANLLLLTVIGVLGISAAAAAVMGSGFDDITPHGQLLGELQRVAEAQEAHHARAGEYAQWLQTLGIEPNPEVRLSLLHGGGDRWEAIAYHPIGLTCTQAGRVEGGVAKSEPPACYTIDP